MRVCEQCLLCCRCFCTVIQSCLRYKLTPPCHGLYSNNTTHSVLFLKYHSKLKRDTSFRTRSLTFSLKSHARKCKFSRPTRQVRQCDEQSLSLSFVSFFLLLRSFFFSSEMLQICLNVTAILSLSLSKVTHIRTHTLAHYRLCGNTIQPTLRVCL